MSETIISLNLLIKLKSFNKYLAKAWVVASIKLSEQVVTLGL